MSEKLHQRAKAIFNQLMDLPPDAQAQQLVKLCGDDALLKREVSSLLEFHTGRSLVAEATKPKIRNRSTLGTTRLHKNWHEKAVACLPLIALVAIASSIIPLLYYISRIVNEQDRSLVMLQLNATISRRTEQLHQWHEKWRAALSEIASKPTLQDQILQLSAMTSDESSQELLNPRLEMQRSIEQTLEESAAYCLWNNDMRLLSCTESSTVSNDMPGWTPFRCSELMRAADGEMIIKFPVPGQSTLPLPLRSDDTTVFYPLKNATGQIIATLAVQSPAFDKSFDSLVLQWNAEGLHLESYVVDCKGHLLSQNRFPEHLLKLRELSNDSTQKSGSQQAPVQGMLLRDPGVSLLRNALPHTHSANWPLTKAVQSVADRKNGFSEDGYRNYVGQDVIGSWRTMPNLDLGVVVEIPVVDALGFSKSINRLLATVAGLCALGTLLSLFYCWPKRRTRDLRSVGPYRMQELLGEGGMGKVYLAEHSLLCRPTAVKVLSSENIDLSVLTRFEREVQLASQLTHPNTISIYDFGRNEDGLFYYAMEYIDGGHLGQLVEFDGPIDGGRCIYLIRQLCFALREAHLAGIVHRDVKPQNVMLCDRGGEPDFIKLVDYGLVKAFAPGISDSNSQTNIVLGTPRFMAPERLQSPWLADPRVDIYSIGCLLYYMLTAQLPPLVTPADSNDFQPDTETLHLSAGAVPFMELLSKCMAYESALRPSSISKLLDEVEAMSDIFPWCREDSEAWWKKRGAKFKEFLSSKRKKII